MPSSAFWKGIVEDVKGDEKENGRLSLVRLLYSNNFV
jgi:hypothetical protein